VGVITDITERKQMEDELRRSRDELDRRVNDRMVELRKVNEQLKDEDRRKTEFLAILGHELRNPLTPIRNAAYALKQMNPTGGSHERPLSIIERQVAQMARLIDDLLDVARITRGKILLRQSRFDLVELVRTAVDDRAEAIEAHGLTLEKHLPPSPLMTAGDPARLSQAIENLLDNAQKFTHPGGRIQVSLELDPAGRIAIIAVRDTGVGIPAALLPHLFEPFSQPEASVRRGGLGLGLALVKGLVELHRGTVEARSRGPGQGAEFLLSLPLNAEAAVEEHAAEERRAHAPCRVLVIEDNVDAAESLALVLEMARHEVTVANSGEQGIELAAKLRPDVVLSDIALGGSMSGFEVARRLRATPALCSTRLVAITGYGQDEDRRRSMEAGFDEHLVKPFDVDALLTVLDRLVLERAAPASSEPARDAPA
jgi:signal transduction histidine kinase/ActR/RegA family two-component response regulator